jgi:hypothetical protein
MMIPIHTGDIQTTIQLMRTHIEAAHMTTSFDQLAILLTLIIESKELSFLDRSFQNHIFNRTKKPNEVERLVVVVVVVEEGSLLYVMNGLGVRN